jgi:hypothetical protein
MDRLSFLLSNRNWFHSLYPVSYEEFLEMFRNQRNNMIAMAHMESEVAEGDDQLVGLDMKIPGGRFDSSVPKDQIHPM